MLWVHVNRLVKPKHGACSLAISQPHLVAYALWVSTWYTYMCRYNVDVRGMCHGNAALFIGKHLLAASASVEERNLGQVTLLRTFITFFIMFLDFLLLFLVLSFCITALNNYCTRRRRRHLPCNISCSFLSTSFQHRISHAVVFSFCKWFFFCAVISMPTEVTFS